MAVSKQPTITPETSSGEGLDEEPTSRGEAKWKRFHPLRVVRKIFRRRIKREGSNVVSDASKKSWSTSELQSVQDDSSGKCEVTSPLKIGLSVSHDSIFSPENNTNIVNNETLEVPHGSSLSVRHTSMKNMFKDELFIRIRARRDSEDDGIGMQSSPYSSPTTVDILNQGFKEKMPKSQTTCSAGSLLSMGSSENDEDSTGQSSGHSSRMSLLDRRSLDSEAESEGAISVPLNHNAAHHKISVRPKRNYGLPRRRMKQVAASKVASLPSTPEVTEDLNKCLQKLEITEIIKSAEFSSVAGTDTMEQMSVSVSSTEKHTSLNSITITEASQYSESSQYAETSQYVETSQYTATSQYSETSEYATNYQFTDISEMKNRTLDETYPQVGADLDVPNLNNSSSDIGQESTNFAVDKHTSSKNDNFLGETNAAERPQNILSEIFTDCKQNLNDNEENEMESYKLIKSTLQDKSKCDMYEDFVLNTDETTLRVASFVKSIEKSDSIKSSDKSKNPIEETKYNYDKKQDHNFENKQSKEFEERKLTNSEELKSGLVHSNTVEGFSDSTTFSEDIRIKTPDCGNDLYKRNTIPEKLDIESEFVLKPLKKDRRFSGEFDSSYKDVVTEKKNDNSLVSSVYLEEESIMSNKSLSIGMEESRIFVSHHTSYSDDLTDVLVTEAHNYAAVDKKPEMLISTAEETIPNKDREVNEPYISSVGISTSLSSEKCVDFHSSISALSDKRVSEDKITISVNSKSDSFKSNLISPKIEDSASHISFSKSSTSVADSDSNQKVTEKQLKPMNKSHLPDISSQTVSVKNANSQKRVSVEIVPFSQRMKEKKYQPISYANKECTSDNKKNSNAPVERKLSDRKIPKSKELDKTSNRHSFSGTISTENKKEDSIIAKKEIKKEKVQYPVQIRIHKSNPKPEIKDKNAISPNTQNYSELRHSNIEKSSDVQHHTNSGKLSQTEKHSREDAKALETTPKWEIKIQNAASHGSISQTKSGEESNLSIVSQKNIIHRSESFKSAQFPSNESKDTDVESTGSRSQENTWKSSKDSSALPDDPEPELLRVFARRSIKQKHCDKSETDESEKQSNIAHPDSSTEITERSKETISISHNSTVIKISENSKPHITKPDLKKKSKSFCEKEKVPRSVSPLKEMNLIQRDFARSSVDSLTPSENLHPRQRLVKPDDSSLNLPPESEKKTTNRSSQIECMEENSQTPPPKEEQLHKQNSITTTPSTSVNGSFNLGMVKENQDMMTGKEAHTPAWLQLAQQRRELREQRERLLLGGSPNSFMDGSSKPSRSSKVWDMVNNFQKLQMT